MRRGSGCINVRSIHPTNPAHAATTSLEKIGGNQTYNIRGRRYKKDKTKLTKRARRKNKKKGEIKGSESGKRGSVCTFGSLACGQRAGHRRRPFEHRPTLQSAAAELCAEQPWFAQPGLPRQGEMGGGGGGRGIGQHRGRRWRRRRRNRRRRRGGGEEEEEDGDEDKTHTPRKRPAWWSHLKITRAAAHRSSWLSSPRG